MTSPRDVGFGADTTAETEALIERYGIVRVTVEHFEFGGYRYSSLEHAAAEARRRRPDLGR